MKKKNKIKLGLIIVIVFIVAVLSFSLSSCAILGRFGSTNNSKTTTSGIETFTVKRGNIIQSLSTAGNVDSSEVRNLSLQISGEVLQSIATGSQIKKGDILLKVDDSEILTSIKQSKINLEIAQNSLKQAKISYQAALDANHIAVQVAQLDNQSSQQTIDEALSNMDDVDSAGKASIENATLALQKAQDSFNYSIAQAQISLNQASDQFNSGNGSYYSYQSAYLARDSAIATATNSLNSATASLYQADEQARANSENAENAYRQALINQSKTYWNTLSSLEQAQQKIESTMESISTSQKQIDLAKINLETASKDVNKNVIIAPFDGIVLSNTLHQGEYSSQGTLVSIASNDFIIKSSVNETDIAKISTGNDVKLSFDTYPEKEFEGEIISISATPTVANNIISYEIRVKLKNTNDLKLFYGLSSNLTIVTAKAENVLIVPVQAVYEENSKQYVDVLINNTTENTNDSETSSSRTNNSFPNRSGINSSDSANTTKIDAKNLNKYSIKKTEVTTGISNYNFIEIKSGLKEGDLVITSNIETTNQS